MIGYPPLPTDLRWLAGRLAEVTADRYRWQVVAQQYAAENADLRRERDRLRDRVARLPLTEAEVGAIEWEALLADHAADFTGLHELGGSQ